MTEIWGEYPAWSPTAKRIVFASYVATGPTGDPDYDLYVIDADGGGLRHLTDGPANDMYPTCRPTASVSPSSRRDTPEDFEPPARDRERTADFDVFVVKADGSGEPKNLTRDLDRQQKFPDRSPDGEWIAIDEEGTVAFVQSNGEGSIRRVEGAALRGIFPAWRRAPRLSAFWTRPRRAPAPGRRPGPSPTPGRRRGVRGCPGRERRVSRRGVCHRDDLDQALDAAEALREYPHLSARDQRGGVLGVAGEERDHPAEAAHLPRGDLVARVVGQPGEEDALHGRVPARKAATACAFSEWRSMRMASVLRPRRTSQQSNGPGTAPSDFCRNLRRSAIVGSFVAAKPPITSEAAEVLRRRVDDDVGAQLERALQVRRRERCRRPRGADGVRGFGRLADVDHVQERVRRRLEPDQAGLLVEVRLEPSPICSEERN